MRSVLVIAGLLAAGVVAPAPGALAAEPQSVALAAAVNLGNKRPVAPLAGGKDQTPEAIAGARAADRGDGRGLLVG